MNVELGNKTPKMGDGSLAELDGAPAVTYIVIPDSYTFDPDVDVDELQRHLYRTRSTGITNRPNDEAIMAVVHADGIWSNHSGDDSPAWVACDDNPAFAMALGRFFQCPVGRPEDIEETHYTRGGPPGVGGLDQPVALLLNNGRDILDRATFGGLYGANGVSTTSPTTNGFTCTGLGAPGSTTFYNGQIIVAGSTSVGLVYGVITSCTNASPPVLAVDQWNSVAAPGTLATTPLQGPYAIMPAGAFAVFVGLSNTNITPTATDTTMTGEITTAGGGLIRKIAPFAHTAGTTTTTLTPVFTANGTDSLPVTVYAMNVSTSIKTGSAVTQMYETSLSASATLSASGDQLTVTWTVTSV